MMIPVAEGLAATALAIAAILAWLALGSLPMRSVNARDILFLPGSLLIGASATGTSLAIASWLGFVREGTAVIASVCIAILIVRRSAVARQIAHARDVARVALREVRHSGWLLAPLPAIAWIYAIAPPRDGDVMRYHLAHVRQIIADGAWQPIADITYAFPFAWSLNYLPFEMLGLPQAAQLVNLGLALVVFVTLLQSQAAWRASKLQFFVIVAFLAHPFVLRTFASAHADGYAMLATTAIAVGLLELARMDMQTTRLLGFCAWVGVGSRYQLVGAGIAATVVVLIHSVRAGDKQRLCFFASGSAAALLLAAPFYAFNYHAFGNPVWPLLSPAMSAATTYANQVAAAFISDYASSPGIEWRLHNALRLMRNIELAPLPAALLIAVGATIRTATPALRNVALFSAFFILLWEVMSPRLYPTHVLPMLPAGVILFGAVIERIADRPVRQRLIKGIFATVIAAFSGLSAVLSWDYARRAVTGDDSAYHRFTWYYDTYDWVNRNTPQSSRFLVIVVSGHSYYLDRRYRRADPWLSGEVNWPRVSSAAALDSLMRREGFDYLIFDDRGWALFPGGAQMRAAVHAGIAAGTLVPVHHEREMLYTSRVRRIASRASVYVLRRMPGT